MFFLYISITIVAGFPNFDYKMPESLPLQVQGTEVNVFFKMDGKRSIFIVKFLDRIPGKAWKNGQKDMEMQITTVAMCIRNTKLTGVGLPNQAMGVRQPNTALYRSPRGPDPEPNPLKHCDRGRLPFPCLFTHLSMHFSKKRSRNFTIKMLLFLSI